MFRGDRADSAIVACNEVRDLFISVIRFAEFVEFPKDCQY